MKTSTAKFVIQSVYLALFSLNVLFFVSWIATSSEKSYIIEVANFTLIFITLFASFVFIAAVTLKRLIGGKETLKSIKNTQKIIYVHEVIKILVLSSPFILPLLVTSTAHVIQMLDNASIGFYQLFLSTFSLLVLMGVLSVATFIFYRRTTNEALILEEMMASAICDEEIAIVVLENIRFNKLYTFNESILSAEIVKKTDEVFASNIFVTKQLIITESLRSANPPVYSAF